jgi:hypothetical protein
MNSASAFLIIPIRALALQQRISERRRVGYVVFVLLILGGWKTYTMAYTITEYSAAPLSHINRFTAPRVHTEWQLPHFGVHSTMMENLAQPCEGGGARSPPFTISTITYKSCSVRSS